MSSPPDQYEFRCPGEPAGISRAVHLARLVGGYPACRVCSQREDLEGLSERSKRKIPHARNPLKPEDFLANEAVIGNLHEGFDALLVRRFAAGFGTVVRTPSQPPDRPPSVAVAGDGRAVTQGHFASAIEGLRWTGCDVVDLGTIPCPALPWTVAELGLDGGLYVGNPRGTPHQAGIRFFGRDGRPVTGTESLASVCRWVETEPDRPVRTWGAATQADARGRYESRLADSFHGLRPLRFRLHTTCRPVGVCFERLLQGTACKVELCESEGDLSPERSAEKAGHFSVAIDDDGQRCRLWNERREPVPFERLFLLLVQRACRREPSARLVVVEEGLPQTLPLLLQRWGLTPWRCGSLPSDMHVAMAGSGATLGVDGTGRIWCAEPNGPALADALATLTGLLGKLSEADRPLSEVLDADVPGH